MTAAKIGIIGGSGLYQMPELTEIDDIEVETPFGVMEWDIDLLRQSFLFAPTFMA